MLKPGGFFLYKMQYTKPALSYEAQADLLLQRGLVADRDRLVRRLRVVGYYRLCAYWHPFKLPDDSFQPGTTLDSVWQRYSFDRCLRLAVMDAIERVEVAVRCNLVDALALRGGPFVHLLASNFPAAAPEQHQRFLEQLRENAAKSSEVFIDHFKATYDEYPDLPIWAAAETMTYGSFFMLFKMSGKHAQQPIARYYGVPGVVFFSWLLNLNYVRNLCAHHSRLWNRELSIRPQIPFEKNDPRWYGAAPVRNDRVFVVLSLLRQLLLVIAPNSGWRERLYSTFDRFPNMPLAPMGVPDDWRNHPLWK